jgi:hypothetical protein
MAEQFQITARPPETICSVGIDRGAIVAEALQRGVREHLESGRDWFHSADLLIQVEDCRFDGTYARVAATMQGHVNTAEIEAKEFAADISSPVGKQTMALATGGLAGLAAQNAIDSVVENLRSDQATSHANPLDQKVLFQLLEHLDATVGRMASPTGLRWKRIAGQRWIAALVMFAAVLILGLVRGGLASRGIVAGLMCGGLAAPLAFLIVHCAGLFAMPASFFTTETAGKKALHMTGVGSVGALRVVVVVAILVLVAALIGTVILAWGSANWN